MSFKALKFLPTLVSVFSAVESLTAKPGSPKATPAYFIQLRPSYRGVKLQITVQRV